MADAVNQGTPALGFTSFLSPNSGYEFQCVQPPRPQQGRGSWDTESLGCLWNPLTQGVSTRVILLPGNTSRCLWTSVVVTTGGAPGLEWVEARVAAQHPAVLRE